MTPIRNDINDLLQQMREMKQQASPGANGVQPRSEIDAALGLKTDQTQSVPNFTEMFSNAINTVNETQKASGALSKAYEQGEAGVSLAQVMVASQKSSVAFEAMTQVRNRLVEAYNDVMQMSI